MKVISREGNSVDFDSTRIFKAVKKAFEACKHEIDDDSIKKIVNEVPIWDGINVEEIQDEVEEILMDFDYKDVAKEYILYRRDRAILRSQRDKLISEIQNKLSAQNIQNQNANVDEASFGGRIGEASRVVSKNMALNYLMSNTSKQNHLNNEIYIHDLDSYYVGEHNCLSVPIDDLLKNGFIARQGDVRPAKSINTAFQLVAVLFQIQSLQQFGGVSATHLDWSMVPYVRKSFYKHWVKEMNHGHKYNPNLNWTDEELSINSNTPIDDPIYKNSYAYDNALELTIEELEQAVEGMYHNLNTLQSRSGN